MSDAWALITVAGVGAGFLLGFEVGARYGIRKVRASVARQLSSARAESYAAGAHDGMAAAGLSDKPPPMLTDEELGLVTRVGNALTRGPVQ